MTAQPVRTSARLLTRRRFLGGTAGLGLLAAGAPLLSACGDSAGSGSAGTLDFMNRWSDPTSQAAANKLFTEFKTATGVSVNNQVQPSNGSTYQPAVRNAFSSSRPPDLATDISGPEVYNLARAGALMDLTAFYNATIKPRGKAGATAGAELDGKVWGISDGVNVGNCVWYNAALLAKYHVDPASLTSMGAWIDAMTQIKRSGGTPLVIEAKDQWPGGHYLNDLVQRRIGSKQATALYNRTVLPHQPDTPKWTDPQVVAAFRDYLKFKPLFQDGFLGEAQATTEYFTRPETLTMWSGAAFTSEPYTFDAAGVQVDAKLKGLFTSVNGFIAQAGADGAALFNDQAVDVNVYTKYIWQGSVGLMSGDVSPEQLAKQLEDATVQAAQKLNG
jgi:ABC-type glycerol-3-phosphate transport system substrate-binding protein